MTRPGASEQLQLARQAGHSQTLQCQLYPHLQHTRQHTILRGRFVCNTSYRGRPLMCDVLYSLCVSVCVCVCVCHMCVCDAG